MISPDSLEIINATAPVFVKNLSEISRRFYRNMFFDHPHMEKDLFNRDNQSRGIQQEALASSIASFATLVGPNPGADPSRNIMRVANKHASLGVTPEQYVTVNKYLFEAVVDVIGKELATDEIMAAWDELYWSLSDILVKEEKQLYDNAGVTPETLWSEARVINRESVSHDAVRLTLVSNSDKPLDHALPGQWASVSVEIDGEFPKRQYNIITPGSSTWEMVIRRASSDLSGVVSNHIVDNVKVGDVLTVSCPFGTVALLPEHKNDNLLLISSGIGVAPILGILNYLANNEYGAHVTVYHMDQYSEDQLYIEEMRQLVSKVGGRMVEQPIGEPFYVPAGAPPEDVQIFLCGNIEFMRQVRGWMFVNGVSAKRIHYETFSPDIWGS